MKTKTSETKRGSHQEADTQGADAPATNLKKRGDHVTGDIQPTLVPAPGLEADGSQKIVANHGSNAEICLQLKDLQAHRIATVKAQLRLQNQARALTRRYMGWHPDLPEKARKKINKAAAKLVKQIETDFILALKQFTAKSVEQIEQVIANFVLALDHPAGGFIIAMYRARTGIDKYRDRLEKKMCPLAESLPTWEFWKDIKGLSSLGLAIVIGEAGNLSDYANPGKLWMRLGLAPHDCYLMTTNEGKEIAAIPKRRRSAIWTVGDSLIKGNRNNGETLEYATLYNIRKAYEHERNPELTKMHAHRRAQRYMEKRLIRNLWQAWPKHNPTE